MTFDYVAPTSVAEAVQLLERHGPDAHVMAGGSALMLLYKQGLVRPGVVVALHQVEGLRGIRRLDDGGLWVGAMTTHRQVETSALVAAYCPALARTFASIATVRIRNQATIGGNLAHADPAQDPPPMLMALDAVVEITGPAGERTSTLDTFFRDIFETSLEPGELITGIRFPAQAARTVASYTKFLPRTEDDYATVSVAVRLVRTVARHRHFRIGARAHVIQ